MGVKLARQGMRRGVPLTDRSGASFSYTLADPVLELISRIDRDASGRIEVIDQITHPEVRDRHIVSSLIEEAASSSILAGAATTVHRAKEMIRSGEEPTDNSERMILNNYRAMRQIISGRALADFVRIHFRNPAAGAGKVRAILPSHGDG